MLSLFIRSPLFKFYFFFSGLFCLWVFDYLYAGDTWLLEFILFFLFLIFLYDIFQRKHTLLKNFPILGHFRFIAEFLRPEIRQYFIASDTEELPFDRQQRASIYRKAKNVSDIIPFGTQRNIYAEGYEFILHSARPYALEEVQSASIPIGAYSKSCKNIYHANIFNISGMSFGALSKKAIIAMNKAARAGGFYQNTGEGGLTPYHQQGGDLVWQIGTGYFGCRTESGTFDEGKFIQVVKNNPCVRMIEIKISQGAKPSEGGILPAKKVTKEIAEIRGVEPYKVVQSPAKHSAFIFPDTLPNFIEKLRVLSGGLPVGIKIAIGRKQDFTQMCRTFVESGVHPDYIQIDGAEGGTGAAPEIFANRVGYGIKDALVIAQNILVASGLRDKIHLACSARIVSGFDLIVIRALGADFALTARGMMLAAGCVQALQCHINTCPSGIATQNRYLQAGFNIKDKSKRITHYHANVVRHFLMAVGALGYTTPKDLRPYCVQRRLEDEKIVSLDKYYEWLKPSAFLKGEAPEDWQRLWDLKISN